MRELARLLTMFALSLAAPAQAVAAPVVTVETSWYEISGTSGEVLAKAMERLGPRHGFLTRAIAQTRYAMNSEAQWVHRDGQCRATRPQVRLSINYVYPRIAGPVPRALQRRWDVFMRGVRGHEETHGRIAREMAQAAHRMIGRTQVADGPGCHMARRQLQARVNAIIAEYEKRQLAFDEVEHRSGGPVEKLLFRLAAR